MKATSGFNKQELYTLLTQIPHGKVTTYGSLAEKLGNKAWARAVGNALHENPDGEKYPCYKVVNSKGELSHSFAFGGLDEQQRLLEAEGIVVENGRVELTEYLVKKYNIPFPSCQKARRIFVDYANCFEISFFVYCNYKLKRKVIL